jgi:predicted transcriptional regulator
VTDRSKKRDYTSLEKLGLNKTAIACYQSLANDGGCKLSELSERLKLPRMSVYRALENLHELSFIYKTKLEGTSTSYAAKPINKALEDYFKYLHRVMNPLLGGYEGFAAKFAKGQHLG